MIAAGLRKAHAAVPEARLLQADVCELPLEDREHRRGREREPARARARRPPRAARDRPSAQAWRARRQWSFRPVRGRSTTTIASSGTSAATRGASWPRSAGPPALSPARIVISASLLYPAFWLVKQRNRRRYGDLRGEALEARVTQDIARTRDSRLGELTWRLEDRLVRRRRAASVRDPLVRRSLAGAVMRTISVVIPAYSEEANIEPVYERLAHVFEPLAVDWELIFCVDPSPDRTEELILELRKRDPRVKMLRFSRRFGQPMATLAGLEAASGDAAVVIDCDLQDPPELIPAMIERWQEGFDVVYAQRRTRAGETLPKRIVAWAGYKVINRIAEVDIPPNTGDFRLMSRRVIDNVVALKEGHGFLRGLVGFVGFRQTSVPYDRSPRAGRHEQVQPADRARC